MAAMREVIAVFDEIGVADGRRRRQGGQDAKDSESRKDTVTWFP